MNKIIINLFILTAFLTSLSSYVKALEIYVSPSGSDKSIGDKNSPIATIGAARDFLRASGKLGHEPCQVILQEGVYRLSQAVTFGPEDSGSEEFPVTYRADEGANVTLTGAQKITSAWVSWKDGIYRTDVGEIHGIDQLFVNDKRQTLARYPNLGAGYLLSENQKHQGAVAGNAPYDGCTPDAWSAIKGKNWADPTGAFMHGMHSGLWGSQHYRVLGKEASGELRYEGGWQNNRHSFAHKSYRMIENVFEELDAPGEWYHDQKEGWLYYKPAEGIKIDTAKFEVVLQVKHLLEFYGEYEQPVAGMNIPRSGNGKAMTRVKNYETTQPVKNIKVEGIHFKGTARTFMETIEPLLRSDWSIYRGAAVHLRGTENIMIKGCSFEELGGNAILVDSYNRGTTIRSNFFNKNGASDVIFVGSFAAVRDPAFSYGMAAKPLDKIDTEVGPKTNDYPADALVEDNLMTLCGRFEKQSSGVSLSMASRITIRHNTISHTPRAAINICDGTWGGHLIEWNDCFETVLETHDHGAFNSWGRDRIWHSAMTAGPNQLDENGIPLISHYIKKYPESPFWDAYQTIIIRHNRMHCDHGWDIDLDDGSSNYEIYNNLCLQGGLKTREGYKRIVTNNVIIGGYTCNVPYPKPAFDVFSHNIIFSQRVYNSSNPTLWGGKRDYTFVHNPNAESASPAVAIQKQTKDDTHSLYGNAQFVAPAKGDFTVSKDSVALQMGFKNFPMSGFGVTSEKLKSKASAPRIVVPTKYATNTYRPPADSIVLGSTVRSLLTLADVSATGMNDTVGAFLVDVPADSELAKYSFKSGDVVLQLNQKLVGGVGDFRRLSRGIKKGENKAVIWRRQASETLIFNK